MTPRQALAHLMVSAGHTDTNDEARAVLLRTIVQHEAARELERQLATYTDDGRAPPAIARTYRDAAEQLREALTKGTDQ